MLGAMRAQSTVPTAANAARHAAWLFAVSGFLALGALVVERNRAPVLLSVAVGDLAVAGVVWLAPWERWPARASLAVVTPALIVIAAASCPDLIPVQARGVFLVLLYAWIGLHHRPMTAIKLAPPIAIAYAAAFAAVDRDHPLDLRALLLATFVGVVVAETIARAAAASTTARDRAERAARTFAAVGRTTSQLAGLEADHVLAVVVDGVMALGYDGVNLAVVDHAAATFEPKYGRGLAAVFEGQRFPTSAGLTGRVLAAGEPVVVDDYLALTGGIPAIARSGARTAVGVPVVADGQVVGVLVAAYARVVRIHPEDIEALRIVAVHAGSALSALGQLATQRRLAEQHARASLTDELTGIGNRRRAHELLADLGVGDSVALLDVDRFKAINDGLGHAAGDQLLRDLAHFLAVNLRRGDHVVRYGGEEFLIIVPATPLDAASRLIDRLRERWAASNPPTTFSAGTAMHHADENANATLARADEALYRAKLDGRNRVGSAVGLVPQPSPVRLVS